MARVESPISWFRPKKHYREFEEFASGLNDEELVEKRRKYDHTVRNTSIISGLGVAAGVGLVGVLVPIAPRETLLASGPMAASVCIVGATRHGLREGEKAILDEEIERRNLPQK